MCVKEKAEEQIREGKKLLRLVPDLVILFQYNTNVGNIKNALHLLGKCKI